jgi:hypothetical protein
MAQVFVLKSDLAANAPTVQVHGSYPDLPWLDRNMMGTQYTPLTVPDKAVVPATALPGMTLGFGGQLASNWRTYPDTICNYEAMRRILEVFTEYMQRNATNDTNRSVLLYGADSTKWPADAVARRNESQRGWNYVSAVRLQNAALINALPNDPTDDAHWPTKITPIYIEPQ